MADTSKFCDWIYNKSDEPDLMSYADGREREMCEIADDVSSREWSREHDARLADYADIFNFNVKYCKDFPMLSLTALMNLYSLPCIEDKFERKRAYDTLLQEIIEGSRFSGKWSSWSGKPGHRFFELVRGEIADMIVCIGWFKHFKLDTEDLIKLLKSLRKHKRFLEVLGISDAGLSGKDILKEGSKKKPDWKDFAKKKAKGDGSPVDRILKNGQEQIREKGPKRLKKMGLDKMSRVPIVAAARVSGVGAYAAVVKKIDQIENILETRYKESCEKLEDDEIICKDGDMTLEQFKDVFGHIDESKLDTLRYWEY